MDREPAVAGRFYPARKGRLADDVAALLAGRPGGRATAEPPRPVTGVLAPHAGYVYSGKVAGATYARVDVPERAVVMCPNHTGRGAAISVWPDGGWLTPLGRVPVDQPLTAALLEGDLAAADLEAHRFEHALEVQLPFLQLRRPEVAIAAVCLGPLSFPQCQALGKVVAAAARRRPALLVASSDMSHYLPAARAREKDMRSVRNPKPWARILESHYPYFHRIATAESVLASSSTSSNTPGRLRFKPSALASSESTLRCRIGIVSSASKIVKPNVSRICRSR